VALPLSSLSPEMSQRSPLQGGGSLSGKRLPDAASVAREFESVFVSMMLKTMRQSMSKDMFAGDDSDTFGGMFDAFMGQHIAENGGIGMAKLFAEAGVSGNAGSVLNGTRATDAVSSQVKPLQEEKLKAYKDAAALAE
ncbi:MAG: rod-binding protein, partial [Fuerstiella sp.]